MTIRTALLGLIFSVLLLSLMFGPAGSAAAQLTISGGFPSTITNAVTFTSPITFTGGSANAVPTSGGPILIPNNTAIVTRDAGNTANYQIARVGSSNDMNLGSTGTNTVVNSNALVDHTGTGIGLSGRLALSSTAPTISSGFGGTPTVTSGSTATSFEINVGSGGVATSGVVGLPTATNGWDCDVADVVNGATLMTVPTTYTTASVTFTNFSRTTGITTAWTASDKLRGGCRAF